MTGGDCILFLEEALNGCFLNEHDQISSHISWGNFGELDNFLIGDFFANIFQQFFENFLSAYVRICGDWDNFLEPVQFFKADIDFFGIGCGSD